MQQVKALPPPETKQEREAKLELAAQQSAAIPAPAVEDEEDVELPEFEMDPEVRTALL